MALNTLLASSQISGVAPAVEDIRNNPGQFPGLARTPFVPAEDGDIIMRVSQRISAGAIYPDGSPAVVEPSPAMTLVPIDVANFKRAVEVKPSQMSLLARIISNGGINGLGSDPGLTSFAGWLRQTLMWNRMGNYQRMENVVWGMFQDSYSYSKNGTIFTVTWGKPAALKPTAATPWATAATATPISDLRNLIRVARDQYGVLYDVMDITTTDLDNLTGTTEFRNKAGVYANAYLGAGNAGFPATADTAVQTLILGKLVGLEVRVNDGTMPVTANDGSQSLVRHLPTGKVVLSRKADHGSGASYDFANATVLETIMAMIAGENGGGSVVGGFNGGPQRGPLSYAYIQPGFQGVEIHDVVRGFPRMHNEAATAVLTVV